jgi:hypothetical protein
MAGKVCSHHLVTQERAAEWEQNVGAESQDLETHRRRLRPIVEGTPNVEHAGHHQHPMATSKFDRRAVREEGVAISARSPVHVVWPAVARRCRQARIPENHSDAARLGVGVEGANCFEELTVDRRIPDTSLLGGGRPDPAKISVRNVGASYISIDDILLRRGAELDDHGIENGSYLGIAKDIGEEAMLIRLAMPLPERQCPPTLQGDGQRPQGQRSKRWHRFERGRAG